MLSVAVMEKVQCSSVEMYNCKQNLNTSISRIFTALHGMQTRPSDENSVCLSVRLSVRLSVCPSHAWIVTKR